MWTMTETLNKTLDAFHRRQLRKALNIKWPKIIENEKLYQLTNTTPWSTIITTRIISWLGHLMRLEPETPARIAFTEALKPSLRKRGRPPTTWIKVIQNDLKNNNIQINLSQKHGIEALEELAGDRDKYKLAFSKAPIRSESSKEED